MFHTFLRPIQWQSRSKHAFRLIAAGVFLGFALPLSACSQTNSDSRSDRRAIAQSQAIASDFLQTELALSPETASRLGLERALGPATSFALDNHSQAGFERRRLVRIELLQRLRQRPRLPEGHILIDDLAIAERALLDLISLEQLGYGRFNYRMMRPYAIDPYSGIWVDGPSLLAFRQSINTVDQASAFVMRLRSLSAALQDTRRRIIADETAGIRIPVSLRSETQKRLAVLADPNSGALDELFLTFNALTLGVPDLEPEDRDALVAMVRQEIEQNLRPSYAQLLDALSGANSESPDRLGMWAQPRGEELFVGTLNASTGDTVAIDRLHERHLQDANDWHDRLQSLLAAPANEDQTDQAIPEALSARLTWFEAYYQDDTIPPTGAADTAIPPESALVALSPRPVWTAIGETSSFAAQSEAMTRLNGFWETQPYAAWRTGAENEQPSLRALVEYPAIVDAWRIYAWNAKAADDTLEHSLMDRAAIQSIGLIQASLAATDTGIHLERWTLENAIDFLATHTGLSATLSEQLALRIAARPGHQSATLVALHRFEALSERAKAVLGAQYSEAEFQRTLIRKGPRPLDMIERDIEAWYGERLGN